MPNATTSKKSVVPRGAANPIEFLIAQGWSLPKLAVAWNLKTDTTIHRLKAFAHVPRYSTAERMAETFGWNSAGEVMDFWSARVKAA